MRLFISMFLAAGIAGCASLGVPASAVSPVSGSQHPWCDDNYHGPHGCGDNGG